MSLMFKPTDSYYRSGGHCASWSALAITECETRKNRRHRRLLTRLAITRAERWRVRLIALRPDVILAVTSVAARLVVEQTQSTVFLLSFDPVAEGLVASVARPGGEANGRHCHLDHSAGLIRTARLIFTTYR